jgi:hypothetical protein
VFLEGLLEELHTDGEGLALRMQAADDRKLVEMMIVSVVTLADENHPLVRELGDQSVQSGQGREIHHGGAGIVDLINTRVTGPRAWSGIASDGRDE